MSVLSRTFLHFALSCVLSTAAFSQTARDQSVMLQTKFNGPDANATSVSWTPPDNAQTATQTYGIIEQHDEELSFMLEPPRTDWWFGVPASKSSWMEVRQTWQVNDLRFMATGYLHAGTTRTGLDLGTDRRVLILVDQGAGAALSTEIQRLADDLQREGWTTTIALVPTGATPRSIKNTVIMPEWYQTTRGRLTHVLLIGDVPYAMSGGFSVKGAVPNPDYHPEHGGAWASDAYYADTETSPGVDAEYQWTDQSVTLNAPEEPNRAENVNIPGDGKFDQSIIPTDLELCVGRIDMRRLPSFGVSPSDRNREFELLRNYLDRDHEYRTRSFEPPMRAVIDDNFGLFARVRDDQRVIESFASSGYRSFAPIVGSDSIVEGDWIADATRSRPALDSFPALFAYGCGGGGYEHCSGVAEIADLVAKPLYAPFTMMFGSYFADVNSDDNIMRSALAADGWVLTCGWGGRPHWFLHPMADGQTIGDCQRLSANNAGRYVGGTVEDLTTGQFSPFAIGERNIHILLLGDPTLTLQGPVIRGELTIQELVASGETHLSWNTSAQHSPGMGTQVAYLVEAGPSLTQPLTVIDTIAPGTRMLAEARVRLPSDAAVVRVRPYFTNVGRLAPLPGRGVIGSRTVSSVAEVAPNEPHSYTILDVLGRPVLCGEGTISELQRQSSRSDLSSGIYFVHVIGGKPFPMTISR